MDALRSLSKAAKEDAVVAVGMATILVGAGYSLYRQLAIPGRAIETGRHGGQLVADVLVAHGAFVAAFTAPPPPHPLPFVHTAPLRFL